MDLVISRPLAGAALHVVVQRCAMDAAHVLGACGLAMAWGQESTRWIAFTPLMVLLWWYARSRWTAFFVATGYHAVASRSLMAGMTQFFDVPLYMGVIAVIGCSAVLGLVWAACWQPRDLPQAFSRSLLRLTLLFVVSTCVPGLGSLAVASPLAASGIMFEGFGWAGLVLFVGFLADACAHPARAVLFVVVCALGGASWRGQVGPASGLEAIHTSMRVPRDMFDFEEQWEIARAAQADVRVTQAPIVVLPESIGGLWQTSMQRAWGATERELRDAGRVAIVGATIPLANGDFDNGAVFVGASNGPYLQRMPIPLAMWRPWSEGRSDGVFRSHWFGPGTSLVNGQRLGMLVCFEAGLAWPVLVSVAEGAQALVALSNGQWLQGTGATNAQRQTLESWGALFGLPVVFAVNE